MGSDWAGSSLVGREALANPRPHYVEYNAAAPSMGYNATAPWWRTGWPHTRNNEGQSPDLQRRIRRLEQAVVGRWPQSHQGHQQEHEGQSKGQFLKSGMERGDEDSMTPMSVLGENVSKEIRNKPIPKKDTEKQTYVGEGKEREKSLQEQAPRVSESRSVMGSTHCWQLDKLIGDGWAKKHAVAEEQQVPQTMLGSVQHSKGERQSQGPTTRGWKGVQQGENKKNVIMGEPPQGKGQNRDFIQKGHQFQKETHNWAKDKQGLGKAAAQGRNQKGDDILVGAWGEEQPTFPEYQLEGRQPLDSKESQLGKKGNSLSTRGDTQRQVGNIAPLIKR